jgi:hypothetical protein
VKRQLKNGHLSRASRRELKRFGAKTLDSPHPISDFGMWILEFFIFNL